MPDTTVTVSIGRNVSAADGSPVPMGDLTWSDFRTCVNEVLRRFGVVHFYGTGTGTSDEWGVEESATWVASMVPDVLRSVRGALAGIAHHFGQDAIAVTVGMTEFVKAEAKVA